MHLSWNLHIDEVCTKVLKRIGLKYISKPIYLNCVRQSFYKFVIQPIIDYACVIWGATSQYDLSRDPKNLLLPIGSFHILEAIEKFWFDGSTVRPIVRFTASQESCYMASLANQQLSYTKKN